MVAAGCRYDRFSFDITDYLESGANELVVHAFDPTEFAHIPIGKQRLHPGRHPSGIFYTSSSGIWQTVWLEPVNLMPADFQQICQQPINTAQP